MVKRSIERVAIVGAAAGLLFPFVASSSALADAPAVGGTFEYDMTAACAFPPAVVTIEQTATGQTLTDSCFPGSPLSLTGVDQIDVNGSTAGDDTLRIVEGAFGLPPIPVHFDGGAGGFDTIAVDTVSPTPVGYTATSTGQPKSGILTAGSAGPFTFENLEPIVLAGAGGTLIIDGSSAAAITTITIDDDGAPNDGVSLITGDGGLEDVSFSGYDSLTIFGGDGTETISLVGLDMGAANPLTTVTLSGDNFAGTDTGSDIIAIRSVPSGVHVSALGGAGNDRFSVTSSTGNLDSILGTVAIDGGAHGLGTLTESLTVNGSISSVVVDLGDFVSISDATSGAPHQYTLDVATASRTGGPTVTYLNVEGVDLYTGDFVDDIDVVATAASISVSVTAGSGADDIDVTTTGDGSIVSVDGGDDPDTIDVATTGANSALFVDAGGGANVLTAATTGAGSQALFLGGDDADTFDVQSTGTGSHMLVLGGDPAVAPGDVLVNPVVALPAGVIRYGDPTSLFEWGEIEADPDSYELGNLVWVEVDGVAGYSAGVDGLVPDGTTVELLLADGTPTGLDTTTTGGLYEFTGLPAGEYYVRIPATEFTGPLVGMLAAPDGNADPDNDLDEDADHNAFDGPGGPAASGVRSGVIELGATIGGDGFVDGEPTFGFRNDTLDMALVAPASIQIDKEVCLDPACDPLLPVGTPNWAEAGFFAGGDPVLWRVTVTNTGGQDLSNVTVTDPAVPCLSFFLPGVLAAGGSPISVACPVPLTSSIDPNTASVEAVGAVNGQVVSDADDASATIEADPSVEVLKSVQTFIADDDSTVYPAAADGAVPVRDGDLVVYRYDVTNTGNVGLTNVVVSDDQVLDALINCGTGSNIIASLLPGQTRSCTHVLGAAVAADHADGFTNVATVDADSVPVVNSLGMVDDGGPVSDTNSATFFVAQPDVDIEKFVQTDVDADSATGPLVSVNDNGTNDDEVRFVFVVTNTGNVALTDVSVVDTVYGSMTSCSDTGGAITIGTYTLLPGDSIECEHIVTATAGQHSNSATVTATPLPTYDGDGNEVALDDETDTDLAYYFGADPSVNVVKTTQTIDSDTPTGPLVRFADPVRWTYTVTNTGNVPLTNVIVTDDIITDDTTIDCGESTDNVIADMAVSEVVVCEAYGLAEAGQYANTGSVVGTPPVTIGSSGGTDVRVQPDETDDNPDHYYGVVLDVEIVKTTQTIDIDSADTPFVPVGDDVAWEYTVTNTGNYELVNVTVTDDQLADADIDCGGGSNVIASLGVSLSATCTAAGTATAGAYANIGSVIGTGPATVDTDGEAVGADTTDESDASAYFGSAPAIDIEKWVNGEDADTQPGVITSPGEALTWEYIVTNTGNVELTDVTVLDDQGVSVDCGEATGNVIATLAVDETVTCTGSGNAPDLGAYTNVGSVTGTAPDTVDTAGASVPGVEVSDEDAANVFTAVPELDIVKYVVTDIDDDANVAPGPSLNRYSLASWKIVVSNTGNVALFDVTVVDPALGLEGAELLCDGGTNVVAMLLPGGSFTCTALTVVTDLGLFTNTATATAQPEYDLDPVGDADAANYTGVVSGGYGDILPATGSGTPLPFGTIASLLMAAGAALVLLTRRRRHTTA